MFRHIKVLIGLTGRMRTERKWRAKEIIGPKQHWAEPIFGIALTITRSIVVISCNGNPSGMLYTKSACLAIHIHLIRPVDPSALGQWCRPSRSSLHVTSVSFKELVSSYTAGKSNFEDLILEVRCESCFASIFEEAQRQLGASSQILEMLADEFPIYHQSFVKERNLEF